MKLFKTSRGIVLARNNDHFLLQDTDWDSLVNDDHLYESLEKLTKDLKPQQLSLDELLPPVGQQEIWAAGVTYYRSKVGRQEESKSAGGGDF